MTMPIVLAYLRPNATPMQDYYVTQDSFTWVGEGGPTAQEVADATMPAIKAHRIAANRSECSRRIVERYPVWRQSNVALGVYAGPEAEARAAEMRDWLAAMVAAENTAADAIEAASTVQAVEAVTVAWPA